MKTKTSKYLIIVAVFVISLTAIYFIKNKNKNNNVNGKSSSEIKLSKKTGQDIYFDAQNISVKYRDIEGKKDIERNLSKEEREKVINYFKNAEFKILEGGSKYKWTGWLCPPTARAPSPPASCGSSRTSTPT